LLVGLEGDSDHTQVGPLVAGIALDVGGAIALGFGFQTKDKVELTITPGANAQPAAGGSVPSQATSSRRDTSAHVIDDRSGRAPPIRDAFSGLTLTARF
ncbi:MAG TPA: hypothetical protein VF294_15910, partial [Polyangiaceae bacterium]